MSFERVEPHQDVVFRAFATYRGELANASAAVARIQYPQDHPTLAGQVAALSVPALVAQGVYEFTVPGASVPETAYEYVIDISLTGDFTAYASKRLRTRNTGMPTP